MSDTGAKSAALGYLWPGLLVVVVSVLGYLQYTPPLETHRPNGPQSQKTASPSSLDSIYTCETRLWQDPLGPYYGSDELRRASETSLPSTQQASETDECVSSGKLSGTWLTPLGPVQVFSQASTTEKQSPPQTGRIVLETGEKKRRLILPVFVRGGPSAMAREKRMRTRYAVTSALSCCRYKSNSPNQMKHLRIDALPLCEPEQGKAVPIVVPYERYAPDWTDPLYDPEDEHHFTDIIVLWMDQEQMSDRPLGCLDTLLKSCFEEKPARSDNQPTAEGHANDDAANRRWAERGSDQWCLRVIGPADTTGLLALVSELRLAKECTDSPLTNEGKLKLALCDHAHQGGRSFPLSPRFYSSRATIEPAALKNTQDLIGFEVDQLVKEMTGRVTKPLLTPPPGKSRDGIANLLPFVNVVGTDWHLAHLIRQELELRNAWPRPFERHGVVAILTEKDTLYGRAIPCLFSMVCQSDGSSVDLKVEAVPESGTNGQVEFTMAATASESQGSMFPFLPGMRFRGSSNGEQFIGSIERWGIERARVIGRPHQVAILGTDRQFGAGGDESKNGTKLALLDTAESRTLRWDTETTTRVLNRQYYGQISLTRSGITGTWDGQWTLTRPLVSFKYLRGLDGRIAANGGESDSSQGKKDANAAEVNDSAMGFDPTGNSQLDYLRRLEQNLTRLHQRLRREGGRGILAVGVLGTDVYDKLLILRALRKRFPETVFFTTDLDTEFSRRSELQHTRNLVVASHFGLELHPSLQRDVPPFRDSYQTATFLATLLAAEDDRACRVVDSTVRSGSESPCSFWPVPCWSEEFLESYFQYEEGTEETRKEIWQERHEDLSKPPYSRSHLALESASRYLHPLVFEIGRKSPYQLTLTQQATVPATETTRSVGIPLTPAYIAPSHQPVAENEERQQWDPTTSLTAQIQPPSDREWLRGGRRAYVELILVITFLAGPLALYVQWARDLLLAILRLPILVFRLLLALVTTLALDIVWTPLRTLLSLAVNETNTAKDDTESGILSRAVASARKRLDPKEFLNLKCPSPWYVRSAWTTQISIAMGLAFGAWLGFTVVHDHFQVDGGEPFSLVAGVSIWPSTFLRLLAVLLCVYFLVSDTRSLAENSRRLLPQNPAPGASKTLPNRQPGSETRSNANRIFRLWQRISIVRWKDPDELPVLLYEYQQKGKWWVRLIRAGLLTCAFLGFGLFLMGYAGESPNMPARGETAHAWGTGVLFLSVLLTILLVFFAIDANFLCRRFVRYLDGKRQREWPEETLHGTTGGRILNDSNRQEEYDLCTIRVIAERTRVVSKSLFGPFTVLLVMILARHTLFDGWSIPWPLIVVFALMFGGLIAQNIGLRREAAKTRFAILRRLENTRAQFVGVDDHREKQIANVIREIEREREGAFRPLAEDSLFSALAIPFGGTGGLLLLDLMMKME